MQDLSTSFTSALYQETYIIYTESLYNLATVLYYYTVNFIMLKYLYDDHVYDLLHPRECELMN